MTVFLTVEEALRIGEAVTGAPLQVRDHGLLESALARPRTSVFGEDAYPTLHEKAASLLQSLVGNHALIDGNKRLGFACTSVFLAINGASLTCSEDEAYDLVIDVATGQLDTVKAIADRLHAASTE